MPGLDEHCEARECWASQLRFRGRDTTLVGTGVECGMRLSELRLLTSPYHLGRERVGMGRGPDSFLDAGVVSRARDRGIAVEVVEPSRDDDFEHEIGATFAVLRSHAARVQGALADQAFPLTLGGNCNTTITTVAALRHRDDLGVVWFDAHGDANTADTTPSGFFDGMPLAVLAGWCWNSLAADVPGFRPVPEANLLLAIVRAIDDDERRLLEDSNITIVRANRMRTPDRLEDRFLPALDALVAGTDRLYVHVDLDAIDLADGHANEFAARDGPTLDALTTCIEQIVDRGHVVAASLTSYNPDCDRDGAALRSGLKVFDRLLSACR